VFHGCAVVEGVQAGAALAQLGGRLRPAQQEQRQQGGFAPAEIENLREFVAVLDDAAAGLVDEGGPVAVAQGFETFANSIVVEGNDRLAVRLLVAGVD
jgi:hypothetical protein